MLRPVIGVGTAFNVLAILAGAGLGTLIGARLSEGMCETAMNAIGLVTVLVGIQSFLRFDDPLVPLVSVILALTWTGGVLLLGLGLVLLDLKQVRVVNMLPAVLVAPLLAAAAPLWPL